MEEAEAESLVRQHVAELVAREYTAERAAREAIALRKIIAGYVEMFPQLQSVVDGDVNLFIASGDPNETPKGAEAVRLILQDSPNAWFLVSELVDALRDRGWLPDSDNPANAVRAALERLIGTPDSDVKKGRSTADKVVYSYRPDDAPPPPRPIFNNPPAYEEEPF